MAEKFFYCAYPFCDYQGTTGLFGFPKDESKRQEWIKKFGIKGEILTRSKICSKHFKVQDGVHEKNGHTPFNEKFDPGNEAMDKYEVTKDLEIDTESIISKNNSTKSTTSKFTCYYPFCNNKGRDKFFKLPTEKNRRNQWISACGLNENTFPSWGRICHKHFRKQDYNSYQVEKWATMASSPARIRLTRNAVPIKFEDQKDRVTT